MLLVNSFSVRDKNNVPKAESDIITKLEQNLQSLRHFLKTLTILTNVKVNRYVAIVVKLIMRKVRASN